MSDDLQDPALVNELKERAGSFVNVHVGLWVAVEDDGTLVLAADSPQEVFQAAADWLAETDMDACAVAGVTWQRQTATPNYTARLSLCREGRADVPQAPAPRIPLPG